MYLFIISLSLSLSLYLYIYMKSSFAKTDNSILKKKIKNHVFFHCAFQLISINLQLGYFD